MELVGNYPPMPLVTQKNDSFYSSSIPPEPPAPHLPPARLLPRVREQADQSGWRRLRQKVAEAEREARRGAELEERLVRLRAEAAAWQAKALSEQAAAFTLHAQLQQAAAAARPSVEELAGGDAGPAESTSSAYVNPRRTSCSSDRACLSCRLRPASVVLLPCRHLSLYSECFAAGDAHVAMACQCVRTGSVEAILC